MPVNAADGADLWDASGSHYLLVSSSISLESAARELKKLARVAILRAWGQEDGQLSWIPTNELADVRSTKHAAVWLRGVIEQGELADVRISEWTSDSRQETVIVLWNAC